MSIDPRILCYMCDISYTLKLRQMVLLKHRYTFTNQLNVTSQKIVMFCYSSCLLIVFLSHTVNISNCSLIKAYTLID